jgi:hypothetical protein
MSRSKAVSTGRTRTSEEQPLTATKGAHVGLGGPALKIPLDALAMGELRAGLDEIAAGRDEVPLTREDLLAALRKMSEAVKPVTHTVIGYIEKTGNYVVANHPVIEMIDKAVDALADLDRGKPHVAFRTASHQANAALTTEQRKRDELDLSSVLIEQKRHRTFAGAARLVARRKRELGQTRDGQPYTAATLIRMRDYFIRRNKSKS